jgi:hypothetical protein
VEEGFSVLDLVHPLLGIAEEAVDVGPGLVKEVLSRPLSFLPGQGRVGRPNGGGDPLACFGDNLHGLLVRPG